MPFFIKIFMLLLIIHYINIIYRKIIFFCFYTGFIFHRFTYCCSYNTTYNNDEKYTKYLFHNYSYVYISLKRINLHFI